MGRKDTIYCARHKIEEEEIERIIKYYKETLDREITKLDASVILAKRSRNVLWTDKKAIDEIRSVKGI